MKLIHEGVASLSLPDDDEYFRKDFYELVICFPPIQWKEHRLDLAPFYPHIHVFADAPGLDALEARHIIRSHLKTKEQRRNGQDYEKKTGDKVKRPEFSKRSTVILARLGARALAAREKHKEEMLGGLRSLFPVRIIPPRRQRGRIEAPMQA